MTPRLLLSRFVAPLGLLATAIFCGCETSRMAFEGDPMPEHQVTAFLQVVSPRSAYDAPPKFVKGYAPYFPEGEARKRHLGYAMAEFTVSADGTVKSVRILKATTLNFAEEAGYTVRDWHFTPAQKGGHPVAVRVRLPFTFRES
jgi:TonB family protein